MLPIRLPIFLAAAAPILSAMAGLTVTEVEGPPTGDLVRIKQPLRDETGPTSFRYYAPRSGPATKTDPLAFDPDPTRDDAAIQADPAEAHYFFRDRDLGQTFRTGPDGFRLGAITVRLQPVDVAEADPTGGPVSVQFFKVDGEPKVNANGTEPGEGNANPRWDTFAFSWPQDPADRNVPDRRPIKALTDDFLEGETYRPFHVATGGIIPAGLETNDYLRWEFTGDDQILLEPNTRYAFVFLFDEPAEPGVNRNIPLSNVNVVPGGKMTDPFPDGHMIRREGSSTVFDEVFIADESDPADVAAARRSASFPTLADGTPDREARLAIPPGTLGYPDVDAWRDLYFFMESEE